MLNSFIRRVVPVLVGCCASIVALSPVAGAAEFEEARTPAVITWTASFEYEEAVVTVSGPLGVTSWTVGPGDPLVVEVNRLAKWAKTGSLPVDGSYSYEVRFAPHIDAATREVLEELRESDPGSDTAGPQPLEMPVISGQFSIADGVIVGAGSDVVEGAMTKDVVHGEDTIVIGSQCVGFDCVNGENFGFDTLRLKENNLRIHFNDTSSSGAFPTNDWRIVANDSSNGGASYLGIEDADAGRMPFRVEAGARTNALYVKSNGRIGIGTSVPSVMLHVAYGDTPSLRLDQDGSGGYSPQQWDVAGNEANFFIRDVTHASKLPFRIQPNTPDSTLTLRADGNVGIGTWGPTAPLEVKTTSRNSTVLLNRTDGGQWYLSSKADGSFSVGTTADETGELLIVDALGNLTTSGTVNGISDRHAKWDFTEVDAARILQSVASLDITSWSLIGDRPGVRHLGPTAQDFYAAFGLGTDDRHIATSDVGGVALAAIQALTTQIQERDRRIQDLERRLEALEKLLQ